MTDEYMAGLHSRIHSAVESYANNIQNCTCSEHVTAVVMEVIRQERHNLRQEGVTYATRTLQEAITCTRRRYEIDNAWPDPGSVLQQMRRTIRRFKNRYERGGSLDDPKLEALAIATPMAPPDNPTSTTPQTEGNTE